MKITFDGVRPVPSRPARSNPLSVPNSTSRRITSGSNCSVSRTHSSKVVAIPTTVSPCRSSSMREACWNEALSSTIRQRSLTQWRITPVLDQRIAASGNSRSTAGRIRELTLAWMTPGRPRVIV